MRLAVRASAASDKASGGLCAWKWDTLGARWRQALHSLWVQGEQVVTHGLPEAVLGSLVVRLQLEVCAQWGAAYRGSGTYNSVSLRLYFGGVNNHAFYDAFCIFKVRSNVSSPCSLAKNGQVCWGGRCLNEGTGTRAQELQGLQPAF